MLLPYRMFLWLRLLHIETAIFANSPEMHGDEENCHERQDHAVQHIKTQQRVRIYLVAAQQQEVNLGATRGTAEEIFEPTVMAQKAS